MELTTSELINDILDLSQINFDEETWLYKCPTTDEAPIEITKWLHQSPKLNDTADELVFMLDNMHIDSNTPKKDIKLDSRTFTRSKKKTRPSIEQVYGDGKPLEFDLSQGCTTSYFDNIVGNSSNLDSFQNMSPPTLVNSICSSTFSNLMESSYIKNDPILREIRDTDYTETVLMQESQPNFQSLTTSCSSLNSDGPEDFLKKCNSFRKGLENATILLDGQYDFNATFKKNQFIKNKSDISNSNNGTLVQDGTITVDNFSQKTIDKVLSREQTYEVYTKNGGSTGSTDNLDECMSVSSTTSSTTDNALNMEGINAIVAMQEKSLQQVVSTPKPNFLQKEGVWGNCFISPITPCPKSDSDMSSSDDYKSAESVPINKNGTITKQKSLSNILGTKMANTDAQKLKSIGSHPTLKLLDRGNQQSKLVAQTKSNLHTMRPILKGSYTSLKPVSANLPVAPPLEPKLDTIQVKNNIKGDMPPPAQVKPIFKSDSMPTNGITNTKPHVRSGLPRPTHTGIPRPTTRIPAPKLVRPKAASQPTGKNYGY